MLASDLSVVQGAIDAARILCDQMAFKDFALTEDELQAPHAASAILSIVQQRLASGATDDD